MTNYEYIKNLDYDDMFELLRSKIGCSVCPAYDKCVTNSSSCEHNLKAWLSEEHKND